MNVPAIHKDDKESTIEGKMPAMGTPAKGPAGGAAAANTPRSISQTNGVTAVVGNPDLLSSATSASEAAALSLFLADQAATQAGNSNDDEGVIAADPESSPGIADGDGDDVNNSNNNNEPQQIPVEAPEIGGNSTSNSSSTTSNINSNSNIIEPSTKALDDTDGGVDAEDDDEDDEEEDESEYEYEDDDDAAFSGFLVQAEMNTGSSSTARNDAADGSSSSAIIVEEDATGNVVGMKSSPADSSASSSAAAAADAADAVASKKTWREPSKAAVNMSLRAESETSGSKRRLAQDLYRIMNQDTLEAGFSLEPASEDSMELWNIKLFKFDDDSNLAKDMLVLGIDEIDLEMKFPEYYPFEPPFVRVVSPRFKRQTGFVMNGALCMELLTKDGWNPVNDIESVIVSIRSLLVVGDGRLQAATELPTDQYEALLKAAQGGDKNNEKDDDDDTADLKPKSKKQRTIGPSKKQIGSYSASEAQAAYSHLTDYHKKKGWDQSGWWARKG